MAVPGSNPSPRRLTGPIRFVLGLAVALAFLLLLELLLGVLPLDRYERDRVGGSHPVFVSGEGAYAGMYVTNPHFKTSMNFQAFRGKKAPGTTRIFVLGSSAAKGWPGSDASAFTGILRRALDAAYPGRFEIVNAAGHNYASHRVLDVLCDVVEFEPDLVVVYSGNNEYVERNALPASARGRLSLKIDRFLRRSRLYRSVRLLLHHVSPSLFRRPEGPDLTDLRTGPVRRRDLGRTPDIDREVLENYRSNIEEMLRILRARGIRGSFCTVPVNLSQWAPAELPPAFEDPRMGPPWNAMIRAAFEERRRKRYGEAETLMERTLRMTPRYAPAHFFRGEALRHLERFEEAMDAFSAACEHDGRPIRELPSFRSILIAACAERGFPVIDLAGEFARHSGKNLVGLDLFIDYCHPNETGHKLIAQLVLQGLAEALGGLDIDGDAVTRHIRADTQAARYSNPAHAAYALGMTHQNLKNPKEAERCYRESLKHDPAFPEALHNLGVIRYTLGDLREAEDLFLKSLAKDPELASSLSMMGLLRLGEGRLREARDYADRLLKQEPSSPRTMELLGDISAAEKDWRAAIGHYTRGQSAGGDHHLLRRKLAVAEEALRNP